MAQTGTLIAQALAAVAAGQEPTPQQALVLAVHDAAVARQRGEDAHVQFERCLRFARALEIPECELDAAFAVAVGE